MKRITGADLPVSNGTPEAVVLYLSCGNVIYKYAGTLGMDPVWFDPTAFTWSQLNIMYGGFK